MTKEIAARADLVMALGGDDHFQYVSHFVDGNLIMGINSDPLTSEGVLNYFSVENFERVLRRLQQEDYQVENWTRLEAILNGTQVGLATCHYFLGVVDNEYMAHYILKFKDKAEEQKSSGLLVATGAGSTGWYDSACRYLYPYGNRFAKTDGLAVFLAREIHRGRLTGYSLPKGILMESDELEVYSLNKSDGRFGIDSVVKHQFPRGSKAVIKISKQPLRVIGRVN